MNRPDEIAPFVLTGASSGIGAAIAQALVSAGRQVIGLGRRRESLENLSRRAGEGFDFRLVDLRDDSAVCRFVEHDLAPYPALGGLIHCAGLLLSGEIESLPASVLDEVMAVNFRAPFLLTSLLASRLVAGGGHLVFINSSAGIHVKSGDAAYCASKFALRALADTARLELNKSGVRVATIYPGRTATPTMQDLYEKEKKPYEPELLLQPADVAAAVLTILDTPGHVEVTNVHLRPRFKSY